MASECRTSDLVAQRRPEGLRTQERRRGQALRDPLNPKVHDTQVEVAAPSATSVRPHRVSSGTDVHEPDRSSRLGAPRYSV